MKAKFIKAVDSGDITNVRLFLINELMLDPRGKSFTEMKSYAESKLNNLYDDDNGKTYDKEESEWDETFLFEVKNDMIDNFSKERLAFYEMVAKLVLKDKAEHLDAEEKINRNKASQAHRTSARNAWTSKKTAYSSVVAGGVVATVAGLCLEKAALATILTSVGTLAMIAGGVFLIKELKK